MTQPWAESDVTGYFRETKKKRSESRHKIYSYSTQHHEIKCYIATEDCISFRGYVDCMSFKNIIYEKQNNVATITINRPQVLNAISHPTSDEILSALADADVDDEVRVVVIRGAGGNFSSGADLVYATFHPEPQPWSGESWKKVLTRSLSVCKRIMELTKPVIAAVEGYCLGHASDIADSCDMTIATKDAKFGAPEIRHSSAPPTLILPWLIGRKKAMELLLTGDIIDASEAEKIGRVNRVVSTKEELGKELEYLTEKIKLIPAVALMMNKKAIHQSYEIQGLSSALAYNQQTTCFIHLSKEGLDWMKKQKELVTESGTARLKQFLKEREEQFKELERRYRPARR
jgi:enoyl-CoA hydratase